MSLLDWFTTRFRDEAKKYKYVEIDPLHVSFKDGHKIDPQPLEAGKHYFRLWLVEMFIKRDRDWFKSWYPAVHSAVTFRFGDKEEVITHVAGQTKLTNVGQENLDKVVNVNHQLTSLLPFNGGTIELDAGLLAMQGSDSLGSFIKVLGDFSSLLVVPQLSAALAVATPLANGITELVGATDGQLVLGLHDTWTAQAGGANLLREKYFAVILAQDQDIREERLWVDNDRLRYGDSRENSKMLTGYHYMLFRIERQDAFDSWDSLTPIKEPYEQALLFLQTGNAEQAEVFIKQAKLAAFKAKELTRDVDRRRVVDMLQKKYDEAKEVMIGSGAFEADPDLSLTSVMAAPSVMSVEAAAGQGPLRLADLELGAEWEAALKKKP